jgi:hypothetical protein
LAKRGLDVLKRHLSRFKFGIGIHDVLCKLI